MARKILRLPTVSDRTGLSFSSIYKQIRLGEFPRGIKLTARATGWDEEAVQGWIDAKLGDKADEQASEG
jgi:prophage regulatory protein|tara:strand:+ start:4436 stop:4642 length:207 start_codon:yes stop_codon:yes gene_type:complete